MKLSNYSKFRNKIYITIILIEIFTVVLLSYVVPVLGNYPPLSDVPEFESGLEALNHSQQYFVFGTLNAILYIVFVLVAFKDIFKFLKKHYSGKKINIDEIYKIRKQCISLPSKLVLLQIITVVLVITSCAVTVSWNMQVLLKLLIIYCSLYILVCIITVAIIQNYLRDVIIMTYNYTGYENTLPNKTKFYHNLSTQLIPFFIAILGVVIMISYSQISDQIGEVNYFYYKNEINNKLKNNQIVDMNNLISLLDSIEKRQDEDTYYIISPNSTYTSNNKTLSTFFTKYIHMFYEQTEGKAYEFYGIDEQSYCIKLQDSHGNDWYIGFKYAVTNSNLISSLFTIVIILLLLYMLLIIIWSKNITKNISQVCARMTQLATDDDTSLTKIMPITTTDEFGQICFAFNKIQEKMHKYVLQIQSKQDMLVEKERLASLGQMIGGIAHNLKTPIMSISGAAEGLNDLIKEYDSSIGDPDVTNQDHHEIASDMNSWIEKIKTHTSYMSDVITAVKGQAVALSEHEGDTFSVEELIKHVDILMKHELKNALIELNVILYVDPNLQLHGNINSLVQVINNMISNAIQAYNGKTNETIEFIVSKEADNVVFSIKDHGMGMKQEVKDKLFKEMITTKGKNGTGLGLFMSYSNIKAHFSGTITFESEEGKGTIFHISIPVNV